MKHRGFNYMILLALVPKMGLFCMEQEGEEPRKLSHEEQMELKEKSEQYRRKRKEEKEAKYAKKRKKEPQETVKPGVGFLPAL